MERCANTEALRAYEDRVAKAEEYAEREMNFFQSDVDDLLDQLANIADRVREISKTYETLDDEIVDEMIKEAIC